MQLFSYTLYQEFLYYELLIIYIDVAIHIIIIIN